MKASFFLILLAVSAIACEPHKAHLVVSSPLGDVRIEVLRAEISSLYSEGDTIRFVMVGGTPSITQMPVGKFLPLHMTDSLSVYQGEIKRMARAR